MNQIRKLFGSLLIGIVRFYQLAISPWLGSRCRFQPTCSQYMITAIREWGPVKGGWIGLKRIGRCHPWGDHGYDPVPRREQEKQHSSDSKIANKP